MAVLNHTACNKQFGTISVSHNINSHSSGAHFRLLIAARSERECEREGEWWMRPLSCHPMTPGMLTLTCTCLRTTTTPPTSLGASIYDVRRVGGRGVKKFNKFAGKQYRFCRQRGQQISTFRGRHIWKAPFWSIYKMRPRTSKKCTTVYPGCKVPGFVRKTFTLQPGWPCTCTWSLFLSQCPFCYTTNWP